MEVITSPEAFEAVKKAMAALVLDRQRHARRLCRQTVGQHLLLDQLVHHPVEQHLVGQLLILRRQLVAGNDHLPQRDLGAVHRGHDRIRAGGFVGIGQHQSGRRQDSGQHGRACGIFQHSNVPLIGHAGARR